MNFDPSKMEKQIRFFKLNPPKKNVQVQNSVDPSLASIGSDQRRFHEIVRHTLKDFQYFSGYQKEEMNLIEGQRILRMNGIKIIKENDTFFIEKYITKQENIINRAFNKKTSEKAEVLKVQYYQAQTLTDPKYFLSMLGYSTKQNSYFKYLELQCYKCPAYGVQIVVYQKRDEAQYVLIESVCNYLGDNPVTKILIEKLSELLIEENIIDPYTLRPHALKHGTMPQT